MVAHYYPPPLATEVSLNSDEFTKMKRGARGGSPPRAVDPIHTLAYNFAQPVPHWFVADTSFVGHPATWTLAEHQQASQDSRHRDWLFYLDSGGPADRQKFHLSRLGTIKGNLEHYLREHSSEDDSDDPVPPAKPLNNNKKRQHTMCDRFSEAYTELGPGLLQLQGELDVTTFQFKRLLKRWCAEHK